jgi:hypothetical protein
MSLKHSKSSKGDNYVDQSVLLHFNYWDGVSTVDIFFIIRMV